MGPNKQSGEPVGNNPTVPAADLSDGFSNQTNGLQKFSNSSSSTANSSNSQISQPISADPISKPDDSSPNQFRPTQAGPQPIVGNFEPNLPPPKNNKKKKFLIAGGLIALLAILAAGFVFGYYLPNEPKVVYRTGLDRSGEAIHQLVLESTDPAKLQQIEKSEFDGSLEVTSDYGNINGTFNAKLDPTKSDSKLDVTFKEKNGEQQKFGLKLLTELQDGSRFPNSYFQLTGIKALQLDAFAPGISDYDGKWIAVEAKYLESLSSSFLPPEEKNNKENVSAEEVAELIRSLSEVNNEYLFSSNPDKAVLENREFLGKEKTAEGIEAFHYKVGINREHAVAYCKAFSEKVFSSRAVKKIADSSEEDIEKSKADAIKDCDNTAKDITEDDTFEMWIDAKYKIIHKIRVYEDKNKKDAYTDVGQIYTGGDKLSFFALYHKDQNNLNVKFTLDVDIKSVNSKAELTASQQGSSAFSGKGSISAKPYEGEINTEKPKGAIPIEEILKKFGFDPTSQSGVTISPEVQKRCAVAYEQMANNNGRGEIPPECANY